MTPERRAKIEEIFQSALDCAPAVRSSFIMGEKFVFGQHERSHDYLKRPKADTKTTQFTQFRANGKLGFVADTTLYLSRCKTELRTEKKGRTSVNGSQAVIFYDVVHRNCWRKLTTILFYSD